MTIQFNKNAVVVFSLFILPGFYPDTSHASNIVFDGSTGSGNENVAVTDPNSDGTYEVDSVDGTASGANLFHSFLDFNIDYGETALFTDSSDAGFNNVIIRVTGGNESEIYGTLTTDTALGDANFYLLNPYGVIFGDGASVDIGGSFYVSTADQLVFNSAQNEVMPTGTTESNFYSAPIEAFGFINPTPAAITLNNASLEVNEGQTLSLVGGNINLIGDGDSTTLSPKTTLKAVNGTIQLASVMGGGIVPVDISDYAGQSESGAITLSSNASIDTSGSTGGRVVIRGGKLSIDNSSVQNNVEAASNNTQPLAGIDIGIVGDMLLDNGTISANSGPGASSRSDGIHIKAGNLSLKSASVIESNMGANSTVSNPDNHQEGLIDIEVSNSIVLNSHSTITTINTGSGKGAAIDLQADSVDISGSALINASAHDNNGLVAQGGDITVNANNLTISGVLDTFDALTDPTGIQSNGGTGADTTAGSGNITVNAQKVLITNNGTIEANNASNLVGGDISVQANNGSIDILNGGKIRIRGAGRAGNITLQADAITVSGAVVGQNGFANRRSGISNSSSSSSANGGNIIIESNQFTLSDGARITTSTAQNETGGNVTISAADIQISGYNEGILANRLASGSDPLTALTDAASGIEVSVIQSPISATSDGDEQGGNIFLSGSSITISDSARVTTEYAGVAENAGNIDIQADNIAIQSGSQISTTQFLNYGTNKPTGNISIAASENLLIDHSTLSSKVNSPNGSGGNISISSNKLFLNGATLDGSANEGNGGNVSISASQLLISPDTVIDVHSDNIDGNIEIETALQINSAIGNSNLNKKPALIQRISPCDINKNTQGSTLLIRQAKMPNYYIQHDEILVDFLADKNSLITTDVFTNNFLNVVATNNYAPCRII